ncbi:hypothetical protein AK812_SmicGene34843 [Symbiodinium microadriaticum]|uniref:Uncharacterized protein n=1 Tax=Symbiodinium microadriaticum TaxID=2951 RepID=A0A1Q9CN09_SYMMI|nr:hypothetical protein AK812_SmicGene34843 [Symbiodinium microadriaticum]
MIADCQDTREKYEAGGYSAYELSPRNVMNDVTYFPPVGLALQEQQKRAKALYEEAQAELAEQASLEAGGAAERYKDYSAQADRDAQQAFMEARQRPYHNRATGHFHDAQAHKLRAAAGKIMIEDDEL